MKILTGGTIGFKIMAKPYEPIDVSTTFTFETEKTIDDELEIINEKVNKVLETQLKKKVDVAMKVYKETRERINKIMKS